MFSVRPAQSIGELVHVLHNCFRHPQRIAELLVAADVDLGQTRRIAPMVGIRDTHRIPRVRTEIDGQGIVAEADESRSEIIEQIGIENMIPVPGQTLHSVIQCARGARTGSSIHIGEVGGIGRIGGGNRIVGKETIFRRNVVVESRLDCGLIKLVLPVENKVVGKPRPVIWKRKEVDNVLTDAVDEGTWNGVAKTCPERMG